MTSFLNSRELARALGAVGLKGHAPTDLPRLLARGAAKTHARQTRLG
jgi:hypothetical protein